MTRSLRFSRPIAALLLLGAMVFGTSTAFAQKADGLNASLSVSPAFEAGTTAPSLGGQNLVVDDGGPEDSIGLTAGGTFLWLNRFTPPAGDFPMQLQSADILFTTAGGFPAGSTFDVFVWSDADGNPANGATLVGSATGNTISVLDVFQTVTFSSPIAIATVGDVLIGARVTAAAGQFPAAIDQTSPQVRSWAGFGAGADTTPPTLPTATFGTIDSFGLPGNWLIRGTYTTGGVTGPLLSVSPAAIPFGNVSVGETAGPTTVTLTNNGTETVTISSIALTGNAAFTINTTGTSLSLAPTASTTFTVSFAPTAAGAATGTVTISSNSPTSPNVVALTGVGVPPPPPGQFPSTDTPIAIGDNDPSGITSTIVVPASNTNTVSDLDVDLNLTHSWTGDLAISLARGATSVIIMDRPGYTGTGFGCSGDNPNIIADDEGTAGAIETGCVAGANPGYPVADGRYTPDQPLSAFDGSPVAGTYVLTVSDNAAGDTGSLDSWALLFSYIVATESGPNGVSRLEVSPNPATTQGQVVLSVATSQAVRVALYDALGREVRVLLDRSLVAGQEAHIGFRTADLPAGVYVIRATGADVSLAERITVVR